MIWSDDFGGELWPIDKISFVQILSNCLSTNLHGPQYEELMRILPACCGWMLFLELWPFIKSCLMGGIHSNY